MTSTEEKPVTVSEEHDASSCRRTVSLPVQKVDDPMAITEETTHVPPRKRQNLLLEIPSRTEESSQEFVAIKMPPTPSSNPTPTPKRVNFLVSSRSVDPPTYHSPGPSTSRGKSSIRNLLPKLSFRYRTPADIEKPNTAAPEVSSTGTGEKPSISRSLSLTKIFTPRIKRASSLPLDEIRQSNNESSQGGSVGGPLNKREAQRKIARSLSVPANDKDKSLRRMDSFFRVVPSTPQVKEGNELLATHTTNDTENEDANGEDIAEEEAVCRICLVDLCEGGETFKLECSCKGELALAHQECAIKWFSIKGNKTCDVCKEEVRNLPVTLLRIQSIRNRNNGGNRTQLEDVNGYRVWQEVPVLVIVSMLAYFCFLEQLLVRTTVLSNLLNLQFCIDSVIQLSAGWKNGNWCNCHISSIFLCIGSTLLHDIINNGEEQVHLDICICSVCSSGSLCAHILLRGSCASSSVNPSGHICWLWCGDEWEFYSCGVF
ncbi:hypothetical protein JHK82_031354 [Glycine max]|nr:hypothetical protein JHK82_031354 [Glycine max]